MAIENKRHKDSLKEADKSISATKIDPVTGEIVGEIEVSRNKNGTIIYRYNGNEDVIIKEPIVDTKSEPQKDVEFHTEAATLMQYAKIINEKSKVSKANDTNDSINFFEESDQKFSENTIVSDKNDYITQFKTVVKRAIQGKIFDTLKRTSTFNDVEKLEDIDFSDTKIYYLKNGSIKTIADSTQRSPIPNYFHSLMRYSTGASPIETIDDFNDAVRDLAVLWVDNISICDQVYGGFNSDYQNRGIVTADRKNVNRYLNTRMGYNVVDFSKGIIDIDSLQPNMIFNEKTVVNKTEEHEF